MTFKSAISKYTDSQIIKRLFELYPDQEKSLEGYVECLYELRNEIKELKPDFKIVVHQATDWYDKSKYWSVDGKKEGDNCYWGIEFSDRGDWLGAELTYDKRLSELSAIAYCLWEMTYMGFTQNEVLGGFKDLIDRVEEIKNEIKNIN